MFKLLRRRANILPVLALVGMLTLSSCGGGYEYQVTEEDRQVAARATAAAVAAETRRAEEARAEYEARTVAVPPVEGRALRYLLAGDSLANGAAATVPANSFRELVKTALLSKGDVESVLAGKPGEGVELIAPQAASAGGGFDVIVVEVGTNDTNRTDLAAFKPAYERMLSQLRADSPEAAIVCLGPWRDDRVGKPYADVIAEACPVVGGRYRGLSQHYTQSANRWISGVMSNGEPAEDNFHPSDAGHEKIATEVLNALRLDAEAEAYS